MPYLHLLGQLYVNKLRLIFGRGVSSIADGRLYLLFVHSSWKSYKDAVIRCMVED